MQPDLFEPRSDRPAGLLYRTGFLSSAEEEATLARLAPLPFRPFEFQGFLGKRETVSFGWTYRFDGRGLAPAPPFPGWLAELAARAEVLAGLEAGEIEQALLIRYGEGASLGWHRDRPVFGDVVGLSLLAPAPLRFRRRRERGWDRFTLQVEPRSAYLLRGESRDVWEHSLPPADQLRYSITLRTLKAARPQL